MRRLESSLMVGRKCAFGTGTAATAIRDGYLTGHSTAAHGNLGMLTVGHLVETAVPLSVGRELDVEMQGSLRNLPETRKFVVTGRVGYNSLDGVAMLSS